MKKSQLGYRSREKESNQIPISSVDDSRVMQRDVTDVIMSFKKQNRRDILNTILEEAHSHTQSMIVQTGYLDNKKMSRIDLNERGIIESSFLKSIASNENLVHTAGAVHNPRREETFSNSLFVENQMRMHEANQNNYRSVADPAKPDNHEFIKLMMEDTIRSGDTDRVINELLTNNFADHLM